MCTITIVFDGELRRALARAVGPDHAIVKLFEELWCGTCDDVSNLAQLSHIRLPTHVHIGSDKAVGSSATTKPSGTDHMCT